MNFCHSLAVAWRLFADRDAIRFEGHRYTFQQLDALIVNAASVLREAGAQRGDRVGLVISNVPAFAVWYYACLRLGAIAVSVSTRLTGEEVGYIISDCDAHVVVATPEHVECITDHLPGCVQQVLSVSECASTCDGKSLSSRMAIGNADCKELEPDEPATILYTSGTTGFPKGVTLSHRNIRATVHAFNHLCQMRPEDRLLLSVPLFHCYGQNALLNAGLNVGATLVLQRGFDLNESKRLIAEHQVTKLFGVPTTFQLLLDSCEPHELESVGYCFSAAATLPLPVSQRWLAKFGQPIYEGYGLTETAPFASYNHRLSYVPGSLGTPVDLVEMKIVHPENGELCPPGCPGEIAIRGPNVMLGYWNRPEDTAAVLRDGWFYSGDIGQTDERGFFYIVDRLKDMIAIGGQKVFPAEVERVLLEHTAVAEAAVVGAPDEVLGEKVTAFVVLTEADHVTVNEIRDFCRQHLASFKVPVTITFRDLLPRNPAGKVLKTELRQLARSLAEPSSDGTAASERQENEQPDQLAAHNSRLPAVSTDTATAEQPSATPRLVQLLQRTHPASRAQVATSHLHAEVTELLGGKAIKKTNATFMELGMDSLLMVQFRDRLQVQVGANVSLSTTIVFDCPTIPELARFLVDTLSNLETSSSIARAQPRTIVISPPPPTSDPAAADGAHHISEMPEEQALDALLREISE